MPPDADPAGCTRRLFLTGLAAGAAAGTATAQPAAPAKLSPEAEAMAQAVLARHGPKLSAEQKEAVRKLLGDLVKGIEAVRAFPLADADEPALPFRVYRNPEGRR
jgi:hypothetical protein